VKRKKGVDVEGLLPMTDAQAEQLAWIHSNRFTVPELYHRKFMPAQTYRNACHLLKKYNSPEVGFLHKIQENVFQRANYFLTAGAIRTLDAQNRILVRNTRYPVKINPMEKKHDLSVQAIRIVFEASEELKGIFWVSDFEMRSGITPLVKADFLSGALDKEKWRSHGFNPNPKGRRTPDGYFEADVEGQRLAFVLEFENHPYSDGMVARMAEYLSDEYPQAYRLVVSATYKNALRMIQALKSKVRSSEQPKWFVSDFQKATSKPFKEVWHQIDQPLDKL
jgi:hypothetical protein